MLGCLGLRRLLALTFLGVVAGGAVGHAESVNVLRSYWSDDGKRIYSDLEVVGDDGSVTEKTVLGGQVGSIAQIRIALLSNGQPLRLDYVSQRNDQGVPLHWAGSCVFLTPDANASRALTLPAIVGALNAAADEWNNHAGT